MRTSFSMFAEKMCVSEMVAFCDRILAESAYVRRLLGTRFWARLNWSMKKRALKRSLSLIW